MKFSLLPPQSYFIVGTDTGVGKTFIASRLIQQFVTQGHQVVGMKPIASGCEKNAQGEWVNEDVTALTNVSNVQAPLNLINPYLFQPAIAPHIAANQAGVNIEIAKISQCFSTLQQQADMVVVEGAGGFLVPINLQETLADLAVALKLPIILVVGMRLGCINHALLTVEAIKQRGLNLAGWVANQIDPQMPVFQENLESLKTRIDAPLLETIAWKQLSDSFFK
jgi:dethiobiotin synthetase